MSSANAAPGLDRLASRIMEAMTAGAGELLAGVAGDGRLEVDGAWTTYTQGSALTFAELYRAEGGPYSGSAEVMAKLAATVRYYLSLLDEKAEVPLATATGGWDTVIPAWEYAAYVELLDHHGEILPPDLIAVLKDGLARISEAHAAKLPAERLHNIPCFSAAALWRAGRLFGEDGWCRAAVEYLTRLVESRKPGGYWAEHTGPTPSYNLVYVNALGTHLADGGEVEVAAALREAGAFHSRFSYPDGSPVSVVDGRVLYKRAVAALGLTGLLPAESAAGYLRAAAASSLPLGELRSNNVVFLPQAYRALKSYAGPSIAGGPEAVPLAGEVSVTPAGGFTAVLSALVGACPLHQPCHWGYERLQHLEVHHPAGGVLVGGGQSRGPEMAFLASGGAHLAEGARMEASGRRLRLDYPWGRAAVELSPGAGGLSVEVEVASNRPVRMFLPVLRGWLAGLPPAGRTEVLEGSGVALEIEPAAELLWPVKPWYTYHPRGEAPEGEWRLGLAWEGPRGLKVGLRFSA